MKNKLSDLNNHLFAELERLGNEELKGEALKEELGRAEKVCKTAEQVIKNGKLILEAVKITDMSPDIKSIPILLE